MSYVLELKIMGLPKMNNGLLRGHWRAKHGHTKAWKRKVWMACWHLKPPMPLERAKLTFTRVSSMEPDFDGLVSGFKATIDGLVECGVLANDKQINIGQPVYLWERGKMGKGFIKIKVEGLPDGKL
jgi:hypothetical protein